MTPTPFTPRQIEALDISQRPVDTCVVAGPGSGKTTVLVEYFRKLVAERVDPVRILAIRDACRVDVRWAALAEEERA